MYLIYDCSSISKPANPKATFSDTFAWPRMIHLSWILLNAEYKPVEDFDCIVEANGFVVDENVLKFTRLEAEEIKRKESPLTDILEKFNATVAKAEFAICHNQNYNENIVAAEFIRQTMPINLFKTVRICLMQEGTYFCKLPSKIGGYKWPTLNELHSACFKQGYSPSNNARADVIAAARCFIKLKKTGELDDLFEDD
jgi:hypothetical protein